MMIPPKQSARTPLTKEMVKFDLKVKDFSSVQSLWAVTRPTCDSFDVGARVSVVEFVVIRRCDLGVGDAGHNGADDHQNEANQDTSDGAPENSLDVTDFSIETAHLRRSVSVRV